MSNGTAFARPAPPHDPAPGTHWEAVPADSRDWAPSPAGKTCRYPAAGEKGVKGACGRPAVLQLMRGIGTRVPWHYCELQAHSYGRWLEDVNGVPTVMEWHPADDPEEQDDPG